MKKLLWLIGGAVCWLNPMLAQAQAPDASPASSAPSSAPASTPSSGGSGSSTKKSSGDSPGFLGKDLPVFDPSKDIVMWDGKTWNVNDNRVFRARLEKYLNAAEQTTQEDVEYQKILRSIMEKLAPNTLTSTSLDAAWSLLPKASNFTVDAHLCDSLADAVYAVWLSKKEGQRIAKANTSLEEERKSLEWGAQLKAEESELDKNPPSGKTAQGDWVKEQQLKRDMRMQPYVTRLAEVNVRMKANELKQTASELQAKIEFQALVVQLFMQRRFQHVVMASRFYRALFGDGDTRLQVSGEAKKLLTDASGLPPTLGVLDSLANEAMRDVREGVEAYQFLLEKNELNSATERLAEAFVIGEYMPEIRSLTREKKRRALEFTQKGNQLLSAIEVKDYERAEKLVKDLETSARDFDNSKPMAVIQTAKTVSAMHLAKAKNAAVSGDRATLEAELKEATEIWPRNPALAEVSGAIFTQADVQQQALVDMDRLISQKNYRQIFDDRVKFIAATALYPDKQEKLRKVLDQMQIVEGAIIRANEVAKRGDYAGAWESAERAFQQFPDDTKLNQVRADFTTQAADFVRSLRTAQDLENKKQVGSGLAWFLKAQQLYPPSDFAREGVARLTKVILPES